jgi:hypothetical protein
MMERSRHSASIDIVTRARRLDSHSRRNEGVCHGRSGHNMRMAQIFTPKRILAAVIAVAGIIFFVLTQIANIIAIARLPKDLREAFVELSQVAPLLAWSIFAIGFLAVAFLFHDIWTQYRPGQKSTVRHEETPRDWPIRELFAYIRPDLPLTSVQKIGPNATVDGLDERWKSVGACVLKQLSLGKLHASGREFQGTKRLQAAPIPADFWRTATFTYWFLDDDGKQVLHASNDHRIQYSEIEVNGAEANAQQSDLDCSRSVHGYAG